MDAPECNVCRKPIGNPSEQRDRVYQIRNGRRLILKQHDVCNEQYAKEKTGLEQVK